MMSRSHHFPDFDHRYQSNVSPEAFTYIEPDLDLKDIYGLIDSVLPFECCLHYQVLPLAVADKCIILGMLNPEDSSALNYIRPILISAGYSFKPKLIDTKTHQSALSGYLKYCNTAKNRQSRSFLPPKKSTVIDSQEVSESELDNFHERPTLIVDNPEEMLQGEDWNFLNQSQKKIDSTPAAVEAQSDYSYKSVPSLVVQAQYPFAPAAFLIHLTPEELWQELLARVVASGIGRLYFERYHSHGRIILSQDGIVKLSLEELNLELFQGVLNQSKHLAKLPPTPVQTPKKITIERFYKQERLMLRFGVVPGKYGEEGTIQVLRGKALEFYEQKQVDKIAEQALLLAQKLEGKLKEMSSHIHNDPNRSQTLSALKKIRQEIDRQIDLLDW